MMNALSRIEGVKKVIPAQSSQDFVSSSFEIRNGTKEPFPSQKKARIPGINKAMDGHIK